MKGLGTATVETYLDSKRVVIYHKTPIYVESDSEIILNNGGYTTITTARKMNQALMRHMHGEYKVRIRNGVMQLLLNNKLNRTFETNITIYKR